MCNCGVHGCEGENTLRKFRDWSDLASHLDEETLVYMVNRYQTQQAYVEELQEQIARLSATVNLIGAVESLPTSTKKEQLYEELVSDGRVFATLTRARNSRGLFHLHVVSEADGVDTSTPKDQ